MTLYNHIGELKYLHQIDDFLSGFSDLIHENKYKGKKIEIELSGLTFVSPIGAISLLLLFEILNQSFNMNITPPKNKTNLISYLERIDFFKHCPIEVKKSFEEFYNIDILANRTRNDTRKVLLELTKIQCDNDIDTLYDSILYILNSHNLDSSEANLIANILSELAANILDHSEGTGYAAIQYYPSFKKVVIGIGDNGIGIINSMKKVLGNEQTDIDIISQAFTGGKTSKDTNRGWGLTDARDFSFSGTKNTTFLLKTHTGIFKIEKDHIVQEKLNQYFPGSYFQIELIFPA